MTFKKFVIKMGHIKIVIIITLFSIIFSSFITWLASFFSTTDSVSYKISIIVPLIIAPLTSWFIVGLLLQINEMEIQMRYIASVDQLTGVQSRTSFFSLSELAINHAIQTKREFTLVMLDLDLFKSINDTYGHTGGDLVLRDFGKLLKSICRKGDIVGRVGGEEFCILFLDCNSIDAVTISKKIISKLNQQTVEFNDKIITYTASLGISSSKIDVNVTLDQLFQQADTALYLSKNSGRNKYSVYSIK